MGGERTNITFYTDVRVADRCRVGDVDGGWRVMTDRADVRAGLLVVRRGRSAAGDQAVELGDRPRATTTVAA